MTDIRTADEIQARQAKLLTPDERKHADKNAALAKKAAAEEHHAARLVGADKLYVGQREVKIVRKAEVDDIDYAAPEAQSVVLFVDTGVEKVVGSSVINRMPSGVV
jgi:hypothetical protein